MRFSQTLTYCLVCLCIVSCSPQEPSAPISKPATKTPLDLSLDDIFIEYKNDGALLEKNSALFETLSKKQAEDEITLSGELLIDENKDYLKSIDGVKINIEFKTE